MSVPFTDEKKWRTGYIPQTVMDGGDAWPRRCTPEAEAE